MFDPQIGPSRHNIHCAGTVFKMSSPNQQSTAMLEMLARYLKRERQWRQVFECGKLAEVLTVFMDSDWVCCKEFRKSTSAGVMVLGRHILKAYTQKQNVIAKSSAKTELYAAALGASEAKEVKSMMCEENVQSGWQVVAMFWELDFAVSSQRQAAGDKVQKSASGDPQQQEKLQDPQQQQRCSRCQRGSFHCQG